jgi:hypothetical protein
MPSADEYRNMATEIVKLGRVSVEQLKIMPTILAALLLEIKYLKEQLETEKKKSCCVPWEKQNVDA